MIDDANLEEKIVTIDGKDFDFKNLSRQAKARLDDLQFVNEQILQKNNELQIADSARIMYLSVLMEELNKSQP